MIDDASCQNSREHDVCTIQNNTKRYDEMTRVVKNVGNTKYAQYEMIQNDMIDDTSCQKSREHEVRTMQNDTKR